MFSLGAPAYLLCGGGFSGRIVPPFSFLVEKDFASHQTLLAVGSRQRSISISSKILTSRTTEECPWQSWRVDVSLYYLQPSCEGIPPGLFWDDQDWLQDISLVENYYLILLLVQEWRPPGGLNLDGYKLGYNLTVSRSELICISLVSPNQATRLSTKCFGSKAVLFLCALVLKELCGGQFAANLWPL